MGCSPIRSASNSGPAAPGRIAVAVHHHHIDIERALDDALVQDLAGLVDDGGADARLDLLGRNLPPRQPAPLRGFLDERRDGGIDLPLAALVAIPARSRLAAEAARLAEAVGDVDIALVADRGLGARRLRRAQAMSRPARSDTAKRPHREAEGLERGIDLVRQRAFLEQILRLLAVARQDAVAHEAVADPADHRDLAQALGEGEAGGDDIVGRRIGPHDLEKLHHVGRAEEMQPDHIGRTRSWHRLSGKYQGNWYWLPGLFRAPGSHRDRGTARA